MCMVIALYGSLRKLKTLFTGISITSIGRFWMIDCIFLSGPCIKSPLLNHKFKCNGTIIQMQWYNIVEEIQILRIYDVIFPKLNTIITCSNKQRFNKGDGTFGL